MKTIKLDYITKIEGHAKLRLGIKGKKVTRCELSSIEGSRYFEGIIKGRRYYEAPEITSRICGICSCAHVIASIQAIESALHYKPSKQTRMLRVLLTLGERIRSHATHLYFLALPDYLGYESALAMVSRYKPQLECALRLIRIGNSIIKVLGARDLHPVSAAVGGWLKLPNQEDVCSIKNQLLGVKKDAIATCKLFFSLRCPKFENNANWFSLVSENEYAVLNGKFATRNHQQKSEDCDFEKEYYGNFIKEYHVPYSTANFVVKSDKKYFVGALARLNNNSKYLCNEAKQILKLSKLKLPSNNPFMNNIAQCIEIVHCISHAISICKQLSEMSVQLEEIEKPKIRAGRGIGCIEVPRGTLWHDYTLDRNGIIINANIITPTAQNLLSIQEDIKAFVPSLLHKKKEEIILNIENLIRSYDPCFSCSAHFLEVEWL